MVLFYRDIIGFKVTVPVEGQNLNDLYWGLHTCSSRWGHANKGSDAPKIVFQVDNVAEVRTTLIAQGVVMGDVRSSAPWCRSL